jgi:hypothetical protein
MFLGGMVLTGITQPLLMRYGINQGMPQIAINTFLLALQGVGARLAFCQTGDKLFAQTSHAYGALSVFSGAAPLLGVFGAPAKKVVGLVAGSLPQVAGSAWAWAKGTKLARALSNHSQLIQKAVPVVTAAGTGVLLANQAMQEVAQQAPSLETLVVELLRLVGVLCRAMFMRLPIDARGMLLPGV